MARRFRVRKKVELLAAGAEPAARPAAELFVDEQWFVLIYARADSRADSRAKMGTGPVIKRTVVYSCTRRVPPSFIVADTRRFSFVFDTG